MAGKIKRLLGFFPAVLYFLFPAVFISGGAAYAANNYSVTITPSTLEVTMKDPFAAIPVTITNAALSTASINAVQIRVSAAYTLSMGSTAPAGWCVRNINVSSGTIQFYVIDPVTADCGNAPTGGPQIAPGASVTFNVMATPASAVADTATDTLTSVSVLRPTGFTQTGTIPSPPWTRRSLDAVITAAPAAVATGADITVNMQVSNKSTSAQTLIASSPAPPLASPAIATLIAGPFYDSTALSGAITDTSSVITVASTAAFPTAPAAVQIDLEKIWYTGKTPTQFTGLTRGYGGTTAASHSNGASVYDLTQFNLSASGIAGDSGTITWVYSADSAGTVSFSARAVDSTLTAKSVSETSNTVTIGDFTSVIAVSPTTVVSGQSISVTMAAQNNGEAALINVAPSALTAGAGCTAVMTPVSGPSPASISSIAPGSSGVFTWVYTVTGSTGQTFCLQGNATANGSASSTASTSNAGAISTFSATVTPQSIPSGSVNKTFTWTINNKGACPLDRVEITIPRQTGCPGASWCYSSSAVTAPAGWTGSYQTGPPPYIRFRDPGGAINIMPGASGVLSITFSTTQTVTADTYVSFPLTLREDVTGVMPCLDGINNYLGGSQVVVTANSMAVATAPAGPIPADGNSRYTITATLTSGAAPLAGKTITFTTTNGSLSSATAVTDATGTAIVTLTAPYSTVATTATVTASYMNAQAITPVLNFSAYLLANLAYWGSITPSCAVPGNLVSFALDVKNVSTTVMTLTSNSYFAFNDGVNTYCAYLDSGSTGAVAGGTVKSLTFGSPTAGGAGGGVTVPAGFTQGNYLPASSVILCPGLASGLFLYESGASNQLRSVTDYVSIAGGCGISIIEWYEMR